ncbi:conserved hypothetical protein [Ricinus communis]|uniref:Uncharacterized protein n=1 Tax=Ricinus communis TaxID=3988 RepID=B9S3T0_RICCO|nr:conserved hypothetical protein [Ricinus communis]
MTGKPSTRGIQIRIGKSIVLDQEKGRVQQMNREIAEVKAVNFAARRQEQQNQSVFSRI